MKRTSPRTRRAARLLPPSGRGDVDRVTAALGEEAFEVEFARGRAAR
ncbi:hypothetical protein ABZ897_41405 [Nonomuraea sp. NPDC046802]